MKDLYIKTPNKQALLADLKTLSENFVTEVYDEETEEVTEVLVMHSHEWSIDYIGQMVKDPAILDEEGNVVQEATYWDDGDRVNMRLVGDRIIGVFEELQANGDLDAMRNGSGFVSPAPTSPSRVFA